MISDRTLVKHKTKNRLPCIVVSSNKNRIRLRTTTAQSRYVVGMAVCNYSPEEIEEKLKDLMPDDFEISKKEFEENYETTCFYK